MMQRWVLSCEHGGNTIPPAYTPLFAQAQEVLASHRGWDPGALPLFELLRPMAHFAISSTTSRLLIELNRSLHSQELFSAYTRSLSAEQQQQIIQEQYLPYRNAIEEAVDVFLQEGAQVYHLSIHSFTPQLGEEIRKADIGLLFDPERSMEAEACRLWQRCLEEKLPHFQIRFNYPYLGTDDGLTTALRQKHSCNYAGIELELNQKWAKDKGVRQRVLQSVEALQQWLRN